jgi:outer membrane biogenesis lipoprotein LolB
MGGLSFRAFRDRMGLSLPVQTLLNWDNGRPVTLDRLCRYLDETGADGAVMSVGDWTVRVGRE